MLNSPPALNVTLKVGFLNDVSNARRSSLESQTQLHQPSPLISNFYRLISNHSSTDYEQSTTQFLSQKDDKKTPTPNRSPSSNRPRSLNTPPAPRPRRRSHSSINSKHRPRRLYKLSLLHRINRKQQIMLRRLYRMQLDRHMDNRLFRRRQRQLCLEFGEWRLQSLDECRDHIESSEGYEGSK